MSIPSAVIFDLGGTLVDWTDWKDGMHQRWVHSYNYLMTTFPHKRWPECDVYVRAMQEAEQAHWRRVEEEQWSGPPSDLISDGFRRLGYHIHEEGLLAVLDAYAHAVDGWAVVFPDARETLRMLKERGYRLGLLSNTWWAAEWHNADLTTHGLDNLLDEILYTSDLAYSKPHPAVFREMATRLSIEPAACVMVGDRMIDDISGALKVGMRAVLRKNDKPWPKLEHIVPSATITHLAELPMILRAFGGA